MPSKNANGGFAITGMTASSCRCSWIVITLLFFVVSGETSCTFSSTSRCHSSSKSSSSCSMLLLFRSSFDAEGERQHLRVFRKVLFSSSSGDDYEDDDAIQRTTASRTSSSSSLFNNLLLVCRRVLSRKRRRPFRWSTRARTVAPKA